MPIDAPLNPPADWFTPPDNLDPTKRVTIEDDGRVHGYVALWDTCHVGLPGCVKPPKESPTGYEYAHVGETETEAGDILKTAVIAGSIPHPSGAVPPANVPDVYANTGRQLMRVRYGNDEHGLWFAGALFPDVSPEDVVTIRASAVSGDWRFHQQWRETPSRGMDFSGAILVNVPGFREDHAGSVNRDGGETHHVAASAVEDLIDEVGTVDDGAVIIGLHDYYLAASAEGTMTETCNCENDEKPTIKAGSFEGTADDLFQLLMESIAAALDVASVNDEAAAPADADEGEPEEADAEDPAAVAAAAVVRALTAQADDADAEQAVSNGEAIQALNMKVDQILETVTRLDTVNIEAQAASLAQELTD